MYENLKARVQIEQLVFAVDFSFSKTVVFRKKFRFKLLLVNLNLLRVIIC